ncbi:MAG: hypothetical protein J1E64_00105 [Acetatifactor sp.]|nr:hypothetical protein [Acetatifactor sp.]
MAYQMLRLLCFFMVLIPLLLGRGALCISYRKQPIRETILSDSVLTGYLIMIGLTEAAHMGTVVLGWSFSDCWKLFALMLVVCLFAAVGILLWDKHGKKNSNRRKLPGKNRKPVTTKEQVLFIAFAALVLIQIMRIVIQKEVYLGGDMTAETVNSFLITDAIYKVNPMTGELYSLGIPFRLQILCLPTFYGTLCALFGLSAEQVVWSIVPIATLLYSYLAYSILARVLFPDKRDQRVAFLIFVALLYLFGDYMYGVDGFGVMHGGFRGVVIRAAVLLPYTFGAVMRRRWKIVILCVLAEACLVWTFYGMGVCLFVAAGLTLVNRLIGRRRKSADGKETTV